VYCAQLHATRQGFEFLHRHLIAHRDVGPDNILINLAEGRLAPPGKFGERPLPFRGRMRCILYTIIYAC
jgi:serine/threonine protein kinase